MTRPLFLADKALFIDVEGTLISSVSTPDEIIFPPAVLSLLHELQKATHGAFALVSGKNTSDLRSLCQNLPLNLITNHGAVIENESQETLWQLEVEPALHLKLEQEIRDWTQPYFPRLQVEVKSHSVAIHYSSAPELAPALKEYLVDLLPQYPPYVLQGGEEVVELGIEGSHKGHAIEFLMARAPFAGRIPIMIGSNITDESAFQTVNQVDGLSLKIGPYSAYSNAQYFLPDTQAAQQLLNEWLRSENSPVKAFF